MTAAISRWLLLTAIYGLARVQEPLEVEIEHFIDCVVNGTPCIIGPDHAKKVAGILSS